MFQLRRKDDEFFPDTNDILIVFDDEKKTSDIQRISEIKEGALIVMGRYKVPIEDTEITNSIEGRNFFYRAPTQSVKETQRLADLEKQMVLNQITQYRNEEMNKPMDITKLLLFGLVFFSFIIMGITSCSG